MVLARTHSQIPLADVRAIAAGVRSRLTNARIADQMLSFGDDGTLPFGRLHEFSARARDGQSIS
jgi:hypothetical protein